jgi:predicted transporter
LRLAHTFVADPAEKYKKQMRFGILSVLLIVSISSTAIVGSSQPGGGADANAVELIEYARRLSELENYDGAGALYNRIALHYRNASDLANASAYYVLAAESFESAADYESAGASYHLAGDCCAGQKECDTALKYYELARDDYRKNDSDYDDSWIDKKIRECKEKSLISGIMIFGIFVGMLKFSSKAAFGMGFSRLNTREILAVASIYLVIPFLMCAVINVAGDALYESISILFGMGLAFGVFQLTIAISLLVIGFYTVRKWNRTKKDVSRRTFLLMALPCPVSLATIFLTCAFLMIAITTVLRRTRFAKKPSNLGSMMIFFGLLYFLSILLVPAYLPVSEMEIAIGDFPVSDMIPGFLFVLVMIVIGFVRGQIRTTDRGVGGR